MDVYGNLKLLGNSSIINTRLENKSADPTFDATEVGLIYFNSVSSTIRLNNGTEFIDITLPTGFNNLITTLGSNWIGSQYNFIPSAFDDFEYVSDLTANSTLFDVLKQFDTAIKNTNVTKLVDLSDVIVTNDVTAGDVMISTGAEFTFSSIADAIQAYGNVNLSDLKDVNSSELSDGNVLIWNDTSSKYLPANMYQTIESFGSVTSHTITHTLNVLYCQVTIIDMNTQNAINDAEINFSAINEITITLQSAAPITVLVSATPTFI